jgi:hypothetical protein
MTDIRSAWLLDRGQTREDTRLTQLGATVPVDATGVLTGVLPGSPDRATRLAGFRLTDQTGLSTTVQPGRAVIQGPAGHGAYPVTLAEPVTLTLADGEASSARTDLICVSLYDADYDPTQPAPQPSSATLRVVQGDAADATPPAVPDLALPLYYVTVPAGASAGGTGIDWAGGGVQDLRVPTVAIGGIVPATGSAAAPGAYTSQLRDANDVLQRWDGTQWVPYPVGIGGIAQPGTSTGGYTGQYRDGTAGCLQRWNGSAWASPIPVPVADMASEAGSTTSTTYSSTLSMVYVSVHSATTQAAQTLTAQTQAAQTATTSTASPGAVIIPNPIPRGPSAAAATFTAPPSGAVLVTVGAAMECPDNADAQLYMSTSVALTTGGTVVSAPSDDRAALGSGAYPGAVLTTYQIGSLTPGTSYTATAVYRTTDSASLAVFADRFVRVDPLF